MNFSMYIYICTYTDVDPTRNSVAGGSQELCGRGRPAVPATWLLTRPELLQAISSTLLMIESYMISHTKILGLMVVGYIYIHINSNLPIEIQDGHAARYRSDYTEAPTKVCM